jgi:hypothetical protein
MSAYNLNYTSLRGFYDMMYSSLHSLSTYPVQSVILSQIF